ncbi:mechanosensitive ion channel family protein [Spirochaeta africana]|uniref:Small-conductance mechanosensitive channel n=1 Tax=Spirochaeta africana (strain ATCC 700263 / DSM 8902 / Z-7692) TaxID=889378 RepID=H9UMI0_SPIAZ|nr:mechanosensitive ion channel family protein [Spirochaeta africana]AFG38723.1 small-conductance mechanosensitive channel [Spirochaeta africana DSM 8902]
METVFQIEFWSDLLNQAADWAFSELPAILVILAFFLIVLRIVAGIFRKSQAVLLHKAEKSPAVDTVEAGKRITTLIGIARGVVKLLLWFVVILMLLQRFGVNIAPILASAGILGLAVGFGAQELVRDVISGFFMLLENQIRAGDVAIINGTGGVVEKIELRTTTLRDSAGVVHVFQNGKIGSLSNMTKEWSAIVLDIGVAYKENTSRVMNVMQQVGDELQADPDFAEKIIAPMEVMGVDAFDDSAIIIRGRIKTRPIMQWSVGREYRKRLKETFDREGIEIPFPHRTVFLHTEQEPLS